MCESGHGDQGLLTKRLQLVVLQQQRGEAPEALEGSLLHQRDLVLLQIQTGHAVVPEEDAFTKDFDAVTCKKEVVRRSGPGLRGGNRREPSVLTVDKDIARFCGLFAAGPGRVRRAAAPRTPHPDTKDEPRLVTEQAGNRGNLSESNLYLSPVRARLAALRPLPFPGLFVSVHWRRRKRSREVKRRKKGLARILGPAGMGYFVGTAGAQMRL